MSDIGTHKNQRVIDRGEKVLTSVKPVVEEPKGDRIFVVQEYEALLGRLRCNHLVKVVRNILKESLVDCESLALEVILVHIKTMVCEVASKMFPLRLQLRYSLLWNCTYLLSNTNANTEDHIAQLPREVSVCIALRNTDCLHPIGRFLQRFARHLDQLEILTK